MTETEISAKIRELMALGILPSEAPLIERSAPSPENWKTRTVVSGPLKDPCSICGDPGPQVAYFYVAGQVVRVHAACDAVWQQERKT